MLVLALSVLQDAVVSSPSAQNTPLAVAAAVFLSTCTQFLVSHLKGRAGKRTATSTDTAIRSLTTSVEALRDDVGDVAGDMRDLRTAMIGLDGKNGLRGDVRKVEERLDGLEERERDRLSATQVGSYRPPV